MNVAVPPLHPAAELLDVIDFKWLMAGAGHPVHVERMQRDPAYACRCLEIASAQPIDALRVAAHRLAKAMGLSMPAAPGAPQA